MMAGQFVGMTAYSVAWLRGGHTERFAAGVLSFELLLSWLTHRWRIGDVYVAASVQIIVVVLIFGWLSVRSPRWWPIVAMAALVLVLLLRGMALVDPNLAQIQVGSAMVGLWYLIDLTLLAGVFERWLAGEAPVGPSRWRALAATPASGPKRRQA